MRSIWCRRACCVLSVCAGPGLSLVYSPAVDGMSGVPGEDGLVVDLVEKLLRDGAVGASALAEDVADQVLAWTVMVHHDPDSARYYRSPVADVRDKAVELAGRPPVPLAEGVVGRDDGYGLAVIERLGLVE